MSSLSDVLAVIGDVVTDVVVRPYGHISPGTDTEARIVITPGGSGANTACWAAHGSSDSADVWFLGRAGRDQAAWHEAALRAAGVQPRLGVDAELATSRVVVLVAADGERTMLTDRGANAALCTDDLPAEVLGRAAAIHVSGYTLILDGPRRAVLGALHATKPRLRSVDASSVGFLRSVGAASFLEWTAGFDLLRANADEAAFLGGAGDPIDGALALSAHYGTVVCTLGARGAVVARRGEIVTSRPAVPATVVDATGTGDAFTGGYLSATVAGEGPDDALREGLRLAAMAVEQIGARPPLAANAESNY